MTELGTVRGRLLERATGKPAVGLLVFFLATASNEQFPVDGDGRFEARIPAGEYPRLHVQSQHRGFHVDHAFRVKPGSIIELGDLTVDVGQITPTGP